jgi:hypothetical protein
MGIKRLRESGGRDDGGEDHGNGKLAHDILSFDSAWPRVSTAAAPMIALRYQCGDDNSFQQ